MNALCRAKPCIICKLHCPCQHTPTPAPPARRTSQAAARRLAAKVALAANVTFGVRAESKSCVVCGSSSAGHVGMRFLKLTCGYVGLLFRHTHTHVNKKRVFEFLFSNFFQNACSSKRETDNTQISETPLRSQFITQLSARSGGAFSGHTQAVFSVQHGNNRSHREVNRSSFGQVEFAN